MKRFMKPMVCLGLRYDGERLWVLDQRKLPHEEIWLESRSPEIMRELIHTLAVRGAPLIGVAAALELGRLAAFGSSSEKIAEAAKILRTARPTAVNLMAAVDRIIPPGAEVPPNAEVVARAEDIFEEDVRLGLQMAEYGASLINDGDSLLTHCNSGGLATAGIGTALGAILRAHEQGKKIHVYVDETRPLLQGARLTAWELARKGVAHTLICDNMAASLMRDKKIRAVFVGADRIAANGDVANKVGTYSLAVLARYHDIPFYVVAPRTTLDANCPVGQDIPIEQRAAHEVLGTWASARTPVFNPAFDVTPRDLITALVLDTGIVT